MNKSQKITILTNLEHERRMHEIRYLATRLHETIREDEEDEWDYEDWVNLEINHRKAEFFDKAEKIYNYFGNFQGAKKFIELMEICPQASRMFFNSLQQEMCLPNPKDSKDNPKDSKDNGFILDCIP